MRRFKLGVVLLGAALVASGCGAGNVPSQSTGVPREAWTLLGHRPAPSMPASSAYELTGPPDALTGPVANYDYGDSILVTAIVRRAVSHSAYGAGPFDYEVTLNPSGEPEVPRSWWTKHKVRPYKSVSVHWQNTRGGLSAFDWGWADLAQPTPDQPWQLIKWGGGF